MRRRHVVIVAFEGVQSLDHEVGETPGRFVERVRMEVARHELETTDDTLDLIAARCGLGTAETLRRVFKRRLDVAPESYRRRFRLAAEARMPA